MTELRLARAILRGSWFNRRQALGPDERDEAWCDHCTGRGYYSDYTLTWHTPTCPVRLACRVLGTADPIGYANRYLRRKRAA